MKVELEAPAKPNVILTLSSREASHLQVGLQQLSPTQAAHGPTCNQLEHFLRKLLETPT